MNMLFCDNPFDSKKVDFDFEDEYTTAAAKGCQALLFSYEELIKAKNGEAAVRRIRASDSNRIMVYRGWMLKPAEYELLYNALSVKNYKLINTPRQYQNCHYMPDSYSFIEGYTPKTVWLKLEGALDYERIDQAIAPFGNSPLILKDYVKSQKHYWQEACYIPSAQDKVKVKAVVEKFLELQGNDLNEGLVFREYIPLRNIAIHSKSGMPLPEEYRLFFFHHQLIGCYPYWEEGQYSAGETPLLEWCTQIAKRVDSNFFSMDIAKTMEGNWIVVELGDGQVAGLPDKADKAGFFHFLKTAVPAADML